jgi:pilus assembly protein CpaB
MRRPIGFFLLTILAASVAALIVYSSLMQKQRELERARAGKISIVVAAHDLAIGTKLDANAIKLVPWPRDLVPAGAALDTRAVLGMIAKADFVEDQPIVTSRLVSPETTSGVLPLMIPKDLRAMSVAVDEVADMAGFILPYTRVDVLLALSGSGNQSGSRSKIILENVLVVAVAQTLERKDQPEPERVVTLLVTPQEAERLALAQSEGKLHLALRSYGDNEVVTTTGTNVEKVMAAFTPETPPTPSQSFVSAPIRIRVRRQPRRIPQRIQLLRDGQVSEVITIDGAGRPLVTQQMSTSQPSQAAPPPESQPDKDLTTGENGISNGEEQGLSSAGVETGNATSYGGAAY